MLEETVLSPRAARLASALITLLGLSGCESGSGDPIVPIVPTGPTCADLASQCIANQQGCVESAAGAQCEACAAGSYAGSTGTCAPLPGTPLAHDFPIVSSSPGQEQLGECRSWTLDNDAEIWVNAVELAQDEHSHHSNWTHVPEDQFDGPDGVWKCGARAYDFYVAVGKGGLLYSQSTQAAHEVQKFPDHTAIRIPPHSRIISDIHILNTSAEAVAGHASLTLFQLAPEEVKVKLTSFHVEYDALDIAPHAVSRFTGDCSVAADVAKVTGAPFAPKVHYLLPHTHTLATGFTVEILGGPSDGQSLLDLGAYNGEAHGRAFDPPVDMSGSDGLRFACQYTNPRGASVGWGFGDQEMCELFGFSDSPVFFQSRVNKTTATGTDGPVQLSSGPCTTEVFPATK
jgi:hypothetical protein